jgi:hypothetical protein
MLRMCALDAALCLSDRHVRSRLRTISVLPHHESLLSASCVCSLQVGVGLRTRSCPLVERCTMRDERYSCICFLV